MTVTRNLRRRPAASNGEPPLHRVEATIEELEAALRIDENRMEDMVRQQPELFYRAAKRLALAISQRDQLHQRVKEICAEVYITLRRAAEQRDERVTETMLEHLCIDSDAVRQIKQQELDADHLASQWWALKDAFADRRQALDQLIKLYLANYYGSDMDRNERNLRSADATLARRAQADMRAQRRLRE